MSRDPSPEARWGWCRKDGWSIAEVLTISALVERTGVPRTSIHFYLREGLLPPPHKSAANRSLYSEDHVELLRRIQELRRERLSIAQIRAELSDDVARLQENEVDLSGLQNERIRKTILRVATEEFLEHGYERARVADIIRKAGVTSQLFYSHFPSKGELLVESFRTFVEWNLAFVEPKVKAADPGERLLWRLQADARANELGSSVLSLIRSETPNGAALTRLIEQAWEPVMSTIVLEFESALKPGATPAVPLELLAYSMLGAMHNASLRASWDDKFSREDLLATHLWLFLTVLAALKGQVDTDSRIDGYRELIKELAAREPESPPARVE